MLFVTKGLMLLRTIENVWFHRLTLWLCPRVNFLCRNFFSDEVFLHWWERPWKHMCNLPWLKILDKFGLTQKIVAYIKDEGSNLQTCVTTFNSIMWCGDLDMVEPFDGSYFGHALSDLYVNMPLPMTRFVMDYIMHQQDLRNPTSINVSHG
jgi:hypothetical protein